MSGHQPPVCHAFAANQQCRFGASCRFSHEVGGGSGGGGERRHRGEFRGGSGRAPAPPHHAGRGHHPHQAVPAFRSRVWHPSSAPPPPSPPPHHTHSAFRLMSYNVLSDALARQHAHQLYPRASPEHLSWRHRWRLITEEVKWAKPDVLCLQEVDARWWAEIRGGLGALGYEGAHARRTGERADGCAVLWLRDAWEAVALPGGGEDEEQYPPYHVLRFAECGLRDNVAVSALLRPRRAAVAGDGRGHHPPKRARPAEEQQQQQPRHRRGDNNDFLLLVSTTHLIFNPKRGDTKLGQLRTLLCELHAQARATATASASATATATTTPIFPIVCGDMNAAPHSAVYAFATQGQLDCLSCDRRSLSGVVESSGAASPFRIWGAAQRQHYLEREAASAAAGAARLGLGQQWGAASLSPPPPPPPPPLAPLNPEALLLLPRGAASSQLEWLRPHQRQLYEARVPPPGEREAAGGVPLALLERLGWDAEGMAQATGEEGEEGEDDEEEEDDEEDVMQAIQGAAASVAGAAAAAALAAAAAAAAAARTALASECVASHPWPGGLASAYATVTGREPPFTSLHAKHVGTLDYVLYHSRGVVSSSSAGAKAQRRQELRPTRVLMPPPLRLLLPPRAPPGVPSDHVSVVVDFEVT